MRLKLLCSSTQSDVYQKKHKSHKSKLPPVLKPALNFKKLLKLRELASPSFAGSYNLYHFWLFPLTCFSGGTSNAYLFFLMPLSNIKAQKPPEIWNAVTRVLSLIAGIQKCYLDPHKNNWPTFLHNQIKMTFPQAVHSSPAWLCH